MITQTENRDFDLQDALIRLGGNRELIEQMVNLFCSHVLSDQLNLEWSINHCDWQNVKRWAHKTAGISGTLGLSNIHELCYDLENAADQKELPLALLTYQTIIVKTGYLKGVKVTALSH